MSVRPTVGWSPFYSFGVFERYELTAPATIRSNYRPNAPVTFSITVPAHPHATRVAVYPPLLSFELFVYLLSLKEDKKDVSVYFSFRKRFK